MASNVLVLKDFKAPQTLGKHFRLLCLTGANKGNSYYLQNNRLIVGRGEKVDIQTGDTKTSREHAELTKVKDTYVITDLGSQNGIIVNEQKHKKVALVDGDKIILGQTVYKFNILNLDENDIKTPGSARQIKEIKNTSIAPKKNNSKMLVIILGGAALFYLFSGDESTSTNPNSGGRKDKSRMSEVSDEYAQAIDKKKSIEDKEIEEKVNQFIQKGLREFREGNYFRAIEEFNNALRESPNHGRASFYLNRTKQALDREIEGHELKGRQEWDSLKMDSAISSYCSIQRLLQNYPEDERYKEADENIKRLEEKLGMEKGAVKCF
jgi:pSer/pThr/pTyr-binding forkhead associated (FHA) protein